MKVAYLHQYFKTPSMSGGTRSYEMALRFVAAGHEVHMVTTRSDPSGERGWSLEVIDGIHVHWLNLAYDNKMSHRRRILSFAAFALRSTIRVRLLRADVVFATSTPLTVAVPGLLATWFARPRLVFEVRDLWPAVPIALGVLRNRQLQVAATWLERLAYRRSAAVVALSEGMADGVRSTGCASRIAVIPNSCDNRLFDVDPARGREFRGDRAWLGDRPLVVYAGTLGVVNGVSYMVDLAHSSLLLAPETRFLVVGDGVEHDKVTRFAQDRGVLGRNFFMEPPLAKREMPAVLSAADVSCSWVIPVVELEANSANKFFDALAARRPVAINHGGWQADLIKSRRLGVVLDPGDPGSGAETLNSFLADESAVIRARSAAGVLAAESFDRDRLAQQLLGVISDAAGLTDFNEERNHV
ncbi:glycosyltransferase family 4 protein [Nocardioides sp.]|uniref:glycosyltransferase family 4 protein n=1 Tax=Nocardioides sp. TaxID=35761 RepID=UPI003D125190